MLKCKHVITVLLAVLALQARAQYDPLFSHYFDMEPSFNAAAVGKETKLNIGVAYGIQMAGYERNPQSMYASADMPFYFMRSYHGAGVQLVSDKIGLFNHTRIEGQYAYKFRLFGGQMSLGVQAGLISESFDGSKLDLGDANDPAFSSTFPPDYTIGADSCMSDCRQHISTPRSSNSAKTMSCRLTAHIILQADTI